MEIDFSIVLVSRNRPSLLASLIKSIEKTAKLNFEVLVGLDNDDLNTKLLLNEQDFTNTRFFFQDRDPNLHKYLNFLASHTKGKYIFGLNDDCELITDGWDAQSKVILDKMGDVCYAVPRDTSIDKVGDGQYASFPIISRAAFEKLGFFMPEDFGNHGADVLLYRIYSSINAVCQLEFYIRHIYHESPTLLNARLHDQTAKEMIDRTMKEGCLNNLWTYDISKYTEKLKC